MEDGWTIEDLAHMRTDVHTHMQRSLMNCSLTELLESQATSNYDLYIELWSYGCSLSEADISLQYEH